MQKTNILTRIAARLTLASMLLLVALILFSWIVNATDTGLNVRSLLSADGVRWFFGTFSADLAIKPLIWLILISVAIGAAYSSGLWRTTLAAIRLKPIQYRARIALIAATAIGAVLLVAYGFLAFLPHAVLLSVTGNLWPSPFSASLIPSAAFILTSVSIIYGLQSGTLNDIDEAFRSLIQGPQVTAPLFPLYITIMALWRSVCFAFYF